MSESDYELAKEYVIYNNYDELVNLFNSNPSFSVNTLDEKGNSLLHHASVNNRIKIIKFLISKGANINCASGPNNETPFIWATRSFSYRAMKLLYDSYTTSFDDGRILEHKDNNGDNPLILSIKNLDINGLYLLLSLGADPNSTNIKGLTPLLYIIKVIYLRIAPENNLMLKPKHHKFIKILTICKSMMIILLKFGANVHASDPENGNTIIHYLASHGGSSYDLYLNILLLQASPNAAITKQKNHQNETPYDVAKRSPTSFKSILYDFFLYQGLPYFVPVLITYVLILFGFYLLKNLGLFKGFPLFLIISLPIIYFTCQTKVIPGLDRLIRGNMYATFSCVFYLIWNRIFPSMIQNNFSHANLIIKLYLFTSLISFIFHFFFMYFKSPLKAKKNETKLIVDRIIDFCPEEGTYDENDPSLINNEDDTPKLAQSEQFPYSNYEDDDNDEFSRLPITEIDFKKDDNSLDNESHGENSSFIKKITNKLPTLSSRKRSDFNSLSRDYEEASDIELDPLNSNCSDVESSSKSKFRLYPLICVYCQSDRRCCIEFNSKTKLSKQVDFDINLIHKNSNTILAYSHHCFTCNECVIDKDHHSFMTGTCVGRNNKRSFVLYCLILTIYSMFSLFLIKYYQYYLSPYTFEKKKTNFIIYFFKVEFKTLLRDPSYFFTTLFLLSLFMSFVTILIGQLTFVANESTMRNFSKDRIPYYKLSLKNQCSNLTTFFKTGFFKVNYVPYKDLIYYDSRSSTGTYITKSQTKIEHKGIECEEMDR